MTLEEREREAFLRRAFSVAMPEADPQPGTPLDVFNRNARSEAAGYQQQHPPDDVT